MRIGPKYWPRFYKFMEIFWNEPDIVERARHLFEDVVFEGKHTEETDSVLNAILVMAETVRDNHEIVSELMNFNYLFEGLSSS